MVAYSFQARFAAPILAGTKRQTIRTDRRRHARPGEELQLYTGMRTRQCKLIGRAICRDVRRVALQFDADPACDGVEIDGRFYPGRQAELDRFAVADGFADWADLRAFWRAQHSDVDRFEGVLILWESFQA